MQVVSSVLEENENETKTIFPNWNFHFRSRLWKVWCDVVSMYVLQSYRSCTFLKHKTRGGTQFWIELAAPWTLANHNKINTLQFIMFWTPVSCDGLNRLWRQRLLLSLCSLWRHKQTLVGVIRPLTGGKCRTFHRVIERYRFQRYLCFHCVFCFQVFFCISFCMNRAVISYLNCIHSKKHFYIFDNCLASRNECPWCWCHRPFVCVGARVRVGYVAKILTLVITFKLEEVGFLYYTCVLRCTTISDKVTLTFDLLLKELNLAITFKPEKVGL